MDGALHEGKKKVKFSALSGQPFWSMKLGHYFSHYCGLVEVAKSGHAHFVSQFEGMQSPMGGGTCQQTYEDTSSIRKPGDEDCCLVSFLLFPPSSNQDFGWKVEIPSQTSTEVSPRKNRNLVELTVKTDHGGCLDAKVLGVPMVPRAHHTLRSAPD